MLHRYVRPSAEIWCLHRGRLTGVLSACDGLHPSPCRASGRLLGCDWSHYQPPAHGDVCRPGKQVASFLFPFTASRRPLAASWFPPGGHTQENFYLHLSFPRGLQGKRKGLFKWYQLAGGGTRLQAGSLSVTPHSRFFYPKAFYSRHPSLSVSLPIGCSDMPIHSLPPLCCKRSLKQVGVEVLNC